MLGPALAHLFVELDNRKDSLTEYEKAVRRELLDAMRAARIFRAGVLDTDLNMSAGAAGIDFVAQSGAAGAVYKNVTGKVFFDPSLKTEVDLFDEGWSGPRTLQTGCDNPNCPNKER